MSTKKNDIYWAHKVFECVKHLSEYSNLSLISNSAVTKGIQIYQRGRQKSFSRKTDKTMANKMNQKTNIEHTTLH